VRARRLLAFRREAVLASPGGGASGWEPRVVEMQLARGEMEMEEAVKQWKQRGHLMALIKPELAPRDPLLDFDEHMKKFAEGAFAVRGRRRARGAAGGGAARARSPATLARAGALSSAGSLTLADFTKGYKPSELGKAERALEAAVAAGTYKSPRRLPGATAATAAKQLPWARAQEARLQ
jgi:hypothetical protein